MKKRIHLIEDDKNLGFIIKNQLINHGFEVDWFEDGKSALNAFFQSPPDLCLLDIMLPETDGYSLAEKFRSKDSHTPILFLTARDMIEDKIKAFKIGADDYITKPFSMEELIYRINVFLKRAGKSETIDKQESYSYKEIEVRFKRNLIKINNLDIRLTEKEKQVLQVLIENKERIVKREEILLNIWGDDDYFKGRSLDVFISKIRKYLESAPVKIENYHSIGFKWEEL